ncbi:MAG TPA: response regulator transcription factor [Solirubrobacteraceae bacterium]|jgi:DNA-binding NarL/FixJ family response regulator|nr:response regulator transcription factor [Solirubrobacteraceae bacterium]
MDARDPITILLARFEDLIGAGLRSLIGADPNMRIVASDVTADQLDSVISEREPLVAILNLATLTTPSDIRRLYAAHPTTQLIVLATNPTPGECNQLLALGASACLGRDVESRDVLTTIHLASRGLHVVPRGESAAAGHDVLTPREADVFAELLLGRSNGEIAKQLSVSVETVRTHARSVFRKLGVRSRRELSGLLR